MLLSFLLIKERALPENLKIKFITYQKTFDELSKKNGTIFVEANNNFQVADLKPEFLSLPSYSMRR
jgi:DNA-binding transcriptional regulator YhcF (GntR family)